MKQYCRYCAFCFEGDGFFCSNSPDNTEPDKYMTEEQIKRVNHCKDFELSALGDVISGRQYQPRKKKSQIYDFLQYSLLETDKKLGTVYCGSYACKINETGEDNDND